jgi:Family of unknown function (DUF5677)
MSSQGDPDTKELAELLALPYSVETQSKITKLLNKGTGDPTHNLASEEHFEGLMMLLSLISSKITGRPMAMNHSLASGMIGKICITAMSTQALYRGHEDERLPFLDHSSIAVLCRAIVETSIMYWYLMEGVDEEEWEFRFHVMKIHDAASRVRLFKRMIDEEANKHRAKLQELREKLIAMPLYQKRPPEQQRRMSGGELIYVNGMRSVVENMNFDQEYFDTVYNYLSAYAHSHPLSYFRDGDYHDFKDVLWRRAFTGYALHHAWVMMVRVAVREMEVSNLESHFDPELVKEVRQMAAHRPTSAVPPS